MINDKIFFDEKDPTGINYDTPFTVYGSYGGRLWSKTSAGTVKFYVQDDAKGKVLQVVEAVYSVNTDITATTYADTGLTATITPKSSTSKIRVVISQSTQIFQSSGGIRGYYLRITRDGTQIYERGIDIVGATGANTLFGVTFPGDLSKLDAPTIPATPVAITYKTQARVNDTTDAPTVRTQPNSSDSTITLIEIEPNT